MLCPVELHPNVEVRAGIEPALWASTQQARFCRPAPRPFRPPDPFEILTQISCHAPPADEKIGERAGTGEPTLDALP